MNKIALWINEILVIPEQLWWRLEVRLAAVFDKLVQKQVRLSARWQTRVQGCHGSTMIVGDADSATSPSYGLTVANPQKEVYKSGTDR